MLKSAKRRLNVESDPTYDWFDQFSKSHPQLRFIQIGAADGLRNDPIREFVIRDRWQGVLIEPLPDVFELLKKNYGNREGLRFLNVAVSTASDPLSFWTFKPDFLQTLDTEERLDYLRKASFDKAHVMKFLGSVPQSVLREIKVPCVTLSTVVEQNMPDGIDLLVIDAEGHEPQILRGIDFDAVRPKAIFFESHHISTRDMAEITAALDSAGYRIEQVKGDSAAMLRS